MGKNIFILVLFTLLSFRLSADGGGKTVSVLATGKWYKLAVTQTGIYKVTWAELDSMGVNLTSVEALKIRLFGNGSGMLPELNSTARIDDLREIAIKVFDGGDGQFDPGDYFLFYGESADKWVFERLTRFFSHQRNLYSDTTYYYLNMDQAPGARVTVFPYQNLTPDYISGTYDFTSSHELDLSNLIRSGKEWYGEVFDNTNSSLVLPFFVPHIDNTQSVRIKTSVAGKNSAPAYFVIWQNGQRIDSLKIDTTDPKEYTRAGRSKVKLSTLPGNESDQTVTLTYSMPTSNSTGWLNFMDLTARSHLVWSGPQMSFRDVNTISAGRISRFNLTGANNTVKIWDVSAPGAINEIETRHLGDTLTFIRQTDSLREFIAFDASQFLRVSYAAGLKNQNLHGQQPTNMVIVSHSRFLEQAGKLADHHIKNNGMTVQVTDISEVYNEFSCGQPDPTAIRDYIRMLYLRGNSVTRPKYLLLFGDGSYDPKNRIPGNNNLIPTYQSVESLNTTTTYVTDDYFGIMAAASGQDANGVIELGIGRFPVSEPSEATVMVNKILGYSGLTYPVRSEWRNVVTFVADDENSNLHMQQAEDLVNIVKNKYPVFNVNKIFFDAYQMIEIPNGQRFPDANTAVNDIVNKGSLIVNYTGHGGETGWSYEQVVTTTDILSWKNADKLPVFVTATCEFSRFDNPERYTAGEMLINQEGGGAIALYSTTRLAFAGDNIMLNKSFFEHLMDKDLTGQNVKMGDLIRISKNENQNKPQLRNFALLGDPAQSIAFPENNVVTKHINNGNANFPDTVMGLSMVTVNGQVESAAGIKLTDFNGRIYCKVFDKPVTYSTLGNRPMPETYPAPFTMQNSLLYSGSVPVTEGEFWLTFPVPKGISLQYGHGKLSYYAVDSTREAAGYNNNIIIGGMDPSVSPENPGPEIELFLNSPSFINGQQIPSASTLHATLSDTNGINWLGLGIGHEIVMVLDNDKPHSTILNNNFNPVFNSFTKGNIEYPLPELSPGKHQLSLKAWDMFDNSSEKVIGFVVPAPPGLRVTNVITAPNPMSDYTRFIFSLPDNFSGDLTISLRIFNLEGILVKSFTTTWPGSLSGIDPMGWDGTDNNGRKLPAGLYPYKAIFTDQYGAYYETNQKLMIIK